MLCLITPRAHGPHGKRKAPDQATEVTIQFMVIEDQHLQIAQNVLVNDIDNNSSFCYSMIWK